MKITYVSFIARHGKRGVVILEGEMDAVDAASKIVGELKLVEVGEGNMLVEFMTAGLDTTDSDIPREYADALSDKSNHNRVFTGKEAAKLFGAKYDAAQEPN